VIEYEHPTPPWYTVNFWPATTTSPLREEVDVFAATLKVTTPDPLPVLPLATVIQFTSLAEFQSHPAPAVTATVPAPPSGRNVRFEGSVV
jgi:hypothetical protein